MLERTTAVWIVVGGLIGAAPALSQPAPNPTQQPVAGDQAPGPLFRVVVVGRSAKAINFRPRDGETQIDFVGTSLAPDAQGEANVEGQDGVIALDVSVDDLEPPATYGGEFLTYVLWAITPEGRATNLGELQIDDDDADLEVTTELQSFGLIVTAEPYFAVTQPSDVVVLEGAPRPEGVFEDRTIGRAEVIEARYELLKRGTYTLNQDPSALDVEPLEPGAPLDLAEARNAVAIARLAGAERYAAETFAKATQLLAEAEQAREQRRRGNDVQQPARQAVQTAEDARLISIQRMEAEYQAQQRALQQKREAEARAQADAARAAAEAEAARRAQAEQDRLRAEAERQAAERAKAEADAAAQRLAQERAAADAARAQADAARAQAEAARLAAESQARQAQEAAAQAERERAELREKLRVQLNQVLETRESARGLIVNISDVLFDFDKANLKPGARERLARVSGILLSTPGLDIAVEGHTDSIGPDGYNQGLSERRARAVSDYLVSQGLQQDVVGTTGFGEAQPVATNETAAGRQQNRRVELIVSGEAIGRASEASPQP